MIRVIEKADAKQNIARKILDDLPEWFGIAKAKENYIKKCVNQIFVAEFIKSGAVGFLSLEKINNETLEIAVMGVLKEFQHNGIGRKLFNRAQKIAKDNHYSFIQVKTLQMGIDDDYDKTNLFYLSLGFKQKEVNTKIWGKKSPCQIYIMQLIK